jgi:thiamine pyrophosphate-dependent acetolactate synthase large subunit-like protein
MWRRFAPRPTPPIPDCRPFHSGGWPRRRRVRHEDEKNLSQLCRHPLPWSPDAYEGEHSALWAGDGAFLMNSQEIETAVREKIPLVVLIWEDGGYGLIEWKMDLELGEHHYVKFGNPDIVKYAESFGAKGYRINSAEELLPTLQAALDDDGVSLIACPVDYSENLRLTDRLGELDETL